MSSARRRAVPGAVKNRSATRRRPTSNPPQRRVRLENDQRRAQLLGLGQRTFSERSYDEVSIDDLASAAGISKGLLYHYFPTKRHLYLAGLRATAEALLHELRQAGSEAAAFEAYVFFARTQHRAYRALVRGGIGSDPEVNNVVDGMRSAVLALLTAQNAPAPVPVSMAASHAAAPSEAPSASSEMLRAEPLGLYGWLCGLEAMLVRAPVDDDDALTRARFDAVGVYALSQLDRALTAPI